MGWSDFGWQFVTEREGITVTRANPLAAIRCTRGVASVNVSCYDVLRVVANIVNNLSAWN